MKKLGTRIDCQRETIEAYLPICRCYCYCSPEPEYKAEDRLMSRLDELNI